MNHLAVYVFDETMAIEMAAQVVYVICTSTFALFDVADDVSEEGRFSG